LDANGQSLAYVYGYADMRDAVVANTPSLRKRVLVGRYYSPQPSGYAEEE
jgi:hypothetical protein